MFRTRAVVISACLGWSLAAIQVEGGLEWRGGRTERAASEHGSTVIARDTAVAAFVNDAPPPALAQRPSEGGWMTPRLLCHRLVPPSSSSGWETRLHGDRRDRRVPNWVSSYLPESEFCSVLSRFRI